MKVTCTLNFKFYLTKTIFNTGPHFLDCPPNPIILQTKENAPYGLLQVTAIDTSKPDQDQKLQITSESALNSITVKKLDNGSHQIEIPLQIMNTNNGLFPLDEWNVKLTATSENGIILCEFHATVQGEDNDAAFCVI